MPLQPIFDTTRKVIITQLQKFASTGVLALPPQAFTAVGCGRPRCAIKGRAVETMLPDAEDEIENDITLVRAEDERDLQTVSSGADGFCGGAFGPSVVSGGDAACGASVEACGNYAEGRSSVRILQSSLVVFGGRGLAGGSGLTERPARKLSCLKRLRYAPAGGLSLDGSKPVQVFKTDI